MSNKGVSGTLAKSWAFFVDSISAPGDSLPLRPKMYARRLFLLTGIVGGNVLVIATVAVAVYVANLLTWTTFAYLLAIASTAVALTAFFTYNTRLSRLRSAMQSERQTTAIVTNVLNPLLVSLSRISVARDQSSAHKEIARLINSALDGLLYTVNRQRSNRMQVRFYEFVAGHLALRYFVGDPSVAANLSADISKSVISLATSSQSLLVSNLDAAPSDWRWASRSDKSLIAVPVYSGSTTFGLILVSSSEADAFSDHDLRIATLFSIVLANGYQQGTSLEKNWAQGKVDEIATAANRVQVAKETIDFGRVVPFPSDDELSQLFENVLEVDQEMS